MTQGTRLSSAVMFVRDLDSSASFYQAVLGLEVVDRSPTAVLLSNPGAAPLVLRAMGSNAAHALGTVGVQYLVWTAASREDLDRCERALQEHSAHRETRDSGDATIVEGSDPDGVAVMIIYPGPDQLPWRKLPSRIYAW
jgi:catechol-2,3-dioxygenase